LPIFKQKSREKNRIKYRLQYEVSRRFSLSSEESERKEVSFQFEVESQVLLKSGFVHNLSDFNGKSEQSADDFERIKRALVNVIDFFISDFDKSKSNGFVLKPTAYLNYPIKLEIYSSEAEFTSDSVDTYISHDSIVCQTVHRLICQSGSQ
jgi:hypothetical protein